MRATAETVEGNMVRLSVEVDESEVDQALNNVVKTLSRDARIPGFRPGKVPRKVLEARMGGAVALRAEALREALPDFYAQAVLDAEVDPIAPPQIDITTGQESGPIAFDAMVQVRPTVAIPGYEGLQVTVGSANVNEEEVDIQVDRLRENDGELIEVSRPAIDGDYVTINVHGTDTSGKEVVAADDFLYEVGSGSVVPELDTELRGSKPAEVLAFSASAPGDDEPIAFKILVKDIKEKKLPETTDEWAAENSEFATLEELRDDVRKRIGRVKVVQAQMGRRDNTLAALIGLVDDEEIPEVLVEDEVHQRIHDLSHRLEQQKISVDQFLSATGRNGEDLMAEIRQEAFRAVKVDLALRALADAQDVSISDEELDTEIATMAERMETTPENLRSQLDHAGRTAAVRSEQRKLKALAWLLDNVDLVDEEGNPISREELAQDEGGDVGSTEDSKASASPIDVTADEADEMTEEADK